ncbi:hypothetical protein [Streptomyces sp900129855]|uniref:Uncharacterized protein n=1 Tax=Streptomyces sp. 900129855 TaxID=3155129 RepID=A0ABV2ZRQ7_9ACTN
MSGIEEFLEDLAALTAKHGILIEGCGCCGSPFLERSGADQKNLPIRFGLTYVPQTGQYAVDAE